MSSSFTGDETAPFFGFLGGAAALVFSSPCGTAKSGAGMASMGVMRPDTGINPKAKSYHRFVGYAHLSSGLACGIARLSAGMAVGIVDDAGVRYGALIPPMFLT
ncbi:hypothetical protein Goari_017179 [Gossypium aridum]|uniref:V-type proton ATPase proteolipid subunit n=1 Tax=Gossypium aridum TaxID=34290 RepID=A0A7J8WLU1_GOSAI|nr:hypothetical protein [Gossypium aridum]